MYQKQRYCVVRLTGTSWVQTGSVLKGWVREVVAGQGEG